MLSWKTLCGIMRKRLRYGRAIRQRATTLRLLCFLRQKDVERGISGKRRGGSTVWCEFTAS